MSSSAINLKGAVGNDALRNLISNAAFSKWSRGISTDIHGITSSIKLVSTSDEWFTRYWPGTSGLTGEGLCSIHRVEKRPHDIGQVDVDGNPLYFLRMHQGGITGGDYANEIITLSQRIPNVRVLQSSSVNLSFYAKGYSAGHKLGVGFTQVFGKSGGSLGEWTGGGEFDDGFTASYPVQVQGKEVVLGTSWKRHSLNFNIPSIAGKEIGVCGDNYTELNFYIQAGTTTANASNRNLLNSLAYGGETIDIANVQLEKGVDLSQFENIQQSSSFADMIGAQVTGIAAGEINNVAGSQADALLLRYQKIDTHNDAGTILNGADMFINLNDIAPTGGTGNNVLKFGQFFKTTNPPIFILSPSHAGTTGASATTAKALTDVRVFGTLTDDYRVLKVNSYSGQEGLTAGPDQNRPFNIFALQLGDPSNESGGGDGGGGGGNDPGGGQGGGPNEDSTGGDNDGGNPGGEPPIDDDDGVDQQPG